MPRRAAPGNRDRIEAALPDDLHQALGRFCGLFGLPFGTPAERVAGWQATALQDVFETAAVLAKAAEHVTEGMSEAAAECRAAEQLGVPLDTVRSRLRRWTEEAYRPQTNVHNDP